MVLLLRKEFDKGITQMAILCKTCRIFLLISMLMIGFTSLPQISAADFTAVQAGNWDDPATWGGVGVPTSADNVTINVGQNVHVSIPESLTVIRDANTLPMLSWVVS
jgi:hypothetical protein